MIGRKSAISFFKFCFIVCVSLAQQLSSQSQSTQGPTGDRYTSLVAQAKADLNSGSPAKALGEAQQAERLDSKRWEAYAVAGLAEQILKRCDAAVHSFTEAMAKAPTENKPVIENASQQCTQQQPTDAGSVELAQGKAAYDPKDFAQAMDWFQKSAAQGNAEAELSIGLLYDGGFGVQRDFAEAMRWYQRSAAQGNAEAELHIGSLYASGGFGVQQDFVEAIRWYKKSAAQGNAQAENNIGAHYKYGLGVPQDYAEAMRWFQKAAAQGNGFAEYNIGGFYENGAGVPQDYAEAIRWYQKAADRGMGDAKQKIAKLQAAQKSQ